MRTGFQFRLCGRFGPHVNNGRHAASGDLLPFDPAAEGRSPSRGATGVEVTQSMTYNRRSQERVTA